MKLGIYYHSTNSAWGGGNQFLKTLTHALQERGAYAEVASADVVLFNSYQELFALVKSFFFLHRTIRVYRLGPVFSLHRPGVLWKLVDYAMATAASMFADAVVFQSQWSLAQARKRGFWKRRNVFVIHNAVDQTIFHPPQTRMANEKIQLVYTSWSTNEKKGFAYLQYLDRTLNFDKYELTFIGNSPVPFTNITMLSPLRSAELADRLRDSDIFVSPTQDDACSNAILEALACGLPVVALASGGNDELVQSGGMMFQKEADLIPAIDAVAANIAAYRDQIQVGSIQGVADQYVQAACASIKS